MLRPGKVGLLASCWTTESIFPVKYAQMLNKAVIWRNQVLILFGIVLILLGLNSWNYGASSENTEEVSLDRKRMIQVEDLSESLANFLLEFSIKVTELDAPELLPFFDSEVELRLIPENVNSTPEKIRWIESNHLELSSVDVQELNKNDLVEAWRHFLERFSELEDARFKIKDSHFKSIDGLTIGDCKIKFFLVGRDNDKKRSWIKGTGHLKAVGGLEERWRIQGLEFDEVNLYRSDEDLFSEISSSTGVNLSLPTYGSSGNDDFVYHGAAAVDLNQDGFIDIVATGIKDTYVYLNKGDGTFQNSSWDIGIPPSSRFTAPLPLDFDNDGDIDLFFSSTGTQTLFENRLVPEGELQFFDVSLESRVALPAHGFSAVGGDINRDGWPDIYVAGYNQYGIVMPNSWHKATNGTPNLLFINQKDGTFRESGEKWGVRDSRWSYAAQFADLTGDGLQDLYVANDFGENAYYVNVGDRFEDRASKSGLLDPGNGMGVSFSDYDNDGVLDVLVTNMSSTAGNRILNRLYPDTRPNDNVLRKIAAGSNLYKGNSNGTFTDVTQKVGSFSLGWSWGGLFWDFDNDGWEDIYISSGFVSGKSMRDT